MSVCPSCGTRFTCGVADGDGKNCWCMQLPALPRDDVLLPETSTGTPACYCPRCLQARRAILLQSAARREQE